MKYKVKKGLILEKKGSKVTIFDPERSVIYELNETASLILNQIKKGLDRNKIINILVKKYKLTETRLRKDIIIFLKELKKYKIII